jgi:hypothetical protein
MGRPILATIALFWFFTIGEHALPFVIKRRLSLGFAMTHLSGSLLCLIPLLSLDSGSEPKTYMIRQVGLDVI